MQSIFDLNDFDFVAYQFPVIKKVAGYTDVKSAAPHMVLYINYLTEYLLLDCSIQNGEPVICNLTQLLYRSEHFSSKDFIRSRTNNFDAGERMIIENNDIYLVDINGERIRTINEAYSDYEKCFVIEGAAILYRNGYYFAIDFAENPILSNAGYTEVERIQIGTDILFTEYKLGSGQYHIKQLKSNEKLEGTENVRFPISQESLFILTDPTGEMLIINDRAEVIIPLGKVTDAESAVMEIPSNERNGLEAKIEPNDILRVLHTSDSTWGIYSAQKHGMLTDFIPFEDASMELYNCFMGNGGFVLGSDDGSRLFTVAEIGDGFEVCLFAEP